MNKIPIITDSGELNIDFSGQIRFNDQNLIIKKNVRNPRKSEPVSPRKILAGELLNFEKAKRLPIAAKHINAVSLSPDVRKQMLNGVRMLITIPAQSVSIPSIKLSELIITNPKIIVNVIDKKLSIIAVPEDSKGNGILRS